VPQTQIVQTGFIQPQTGFVQPQTGFIQPQTGFIPASTTTVASTYDSNSFVVQPQQVQQVQPQVFQTQPQNVQYQAVQSVPVTTSQTDDSLLPQNSQNPNFRYVAAVPAKSNNQFLLSRVRQIVPNAFFANSGRGAYIHAGAYQSRDAAESVSRYLRSQGVDSRVLYF
jgi:cell division protein FtsN